MTSDGFIIETVAEPQSVERRWRSLAAAAPSRFFLSWPWMSAWLAATGARPLLLSRRSGDRDGALAFLCCARGALGSRIVALNETGIAASDVGYIEYNGMLGGRDDGEAIDAAVRFLLAARAAGPIAGWHELRLSGVSRRWAASFAAAGAWVTIRSTQRSFAVDLQRLREAGGDVLAAMNANTRQQIRRARRLYAASGPLAIACVAGDGERRAAIAELATLHQARWRAKGAPGAFASPLFTRLVATLVERGGAAGDVEILRATAGTRTIGILFNLVCAGEVANYLGAFVPEDDNRLKPGLVAHSLAIEHHLAAGSRVYDLLAGEARYKASLATPREEMVWLSVRPRSLRALCAAGVERLQARLRRPHVATAAS